MKKVMMAVCGVILGVVAIGGFIGCETTDDGGGLTVTPSEAELRQDDKTVTFTVGGSSTDTNGTSVAFGGIRDLSGPYIWSVSDTSLGNITSVNGVQAVYVRTEKSGVNIITVEDQYGAKGIASVMFISDSVSTGGDSNE